MTSAVERPSNLNTEPRILIAVASSSMSAEGGLQYQEATLQQRNEGNNFHISDDFVVAARYTFPTYCGCRQER